MSYQLQEINRRIDQDVKGFLEECDAQYAQKVSQAADAILTNLPHSPIVLLSGPSGSGKTTTAQKIEEELTKRGIRTYTISMDNYFRTVDPATAPRTKEGDIDFESPKCMDMDLLNEHFTKLARGERILVPKYEFARQMRKEIRLHEIQAPTYDCNREPIMDVNRIRELLPHRYPMQLVDKVIEIGANYIVGVKNVTSNEPFFQGHFPQEPVMPGVLQIEAMAQTGGLLVLNSVDEPERYSTYFMKIDGVKFRQKVVPGDTLIFRVELMAPIRRGISTMKGYVFVGEKVVCEAEFMAQIVKNK